MTKLREELEERNAEVQQLKMDDESEKSQWLLQYVYDQLNLANKKLLAHSENQVSSLLLYFYVTVCMFKEWTS